MHELSHMLPDLKNQSLAIQVLYKLSSLMYINLKYDVIYINDPLHTDQEN